MADNKGDDGVFLFLFLLVVLWGGGWLVWKYFRPQVTHAIVSVRQVEMGIASLWTSDDEIIRVPMKKEISNGSGFQKKLGDMAIVWNDAQFGTWRKFADTAPVSQIQGDHVKVMTYVALYPLRWLSMGILVGMFLWVIFTGPTSHFRRVLGLEQLMVDQARTFKVIRPFLKFNPNTLPIRPPGAPVPIELPMFAEALGPEEWIAFNDIPMPDGVLDRTAAEAAFAEQLGPRWKGHTDLPTELQILLAAFCLKASRKRLESDDMIGRLATCWDHVGGLKLSRDRRLARDARKVLRDKKLSEKTLTNCNRHAYVSTALIRALNTAREEGGVLSPGTFVWLRAHNRALWYPLNNLGRQAYHLEALGVASHYRAEKQVNRPIPRPRVMDAVDGLLEHLKNPILARPIPPVDYGKKGKRTKKNTGVMKPKAA